MSKRASRLVGNMTEEQKARRLETCRRYRERNRETIRESGKKWQRANKDVGARWYQAHREDILEKSRKERAETNKEARLALAKRQEERAERQKKYAAKREAAKALADKGMKRCATCGEEKPVSSFGVVTFSSGTKGPRSNCFECRRSDWSNATEEEKAKRREEITERVRIMRIGSVMTWNPPILCSAKGCTTLRTTGGRNGPIKEGVLCDKHHAEKQRRNLDDPYVACKLKRSIGVKNPPQELIELKRVQLKIHRLINRGSEI
jgi:hypothetical protein